MAVPAVGAIPGYRWCPERNRYFLDNQAGPSSTPASAARQAGKRRAPTADDEPSKKAFERPKARRHRRPKLPFEELVSFRLSSRSSLLSKLDDYALSHPRHTHSFFPDALPVGDSVEALASWVNPRTDAVSLFAGGRLGSLLFGPLRWEETGRPWDMLWAMSSALTSISVAGSAMIATCLGAPASAILISLSDSGHEPMFEFTFPIETLWTSSASPHTHAVGTDAAIVAWKTSWVDNETFHTNSAVYAIEQGPSMMVAGTRSGKVLLYDRRSSTATYRYTDGGGKKAKGTRSHTILDMPGAVTNLRLLNSDRQLLVAGMSNQLVLYDLRFLGQNPSSAPASSPSVAPVLTFSGHVNQFRRGLGFALHNETHVFAAGQDDVIRGWSISDASPLASKDWSIGVDGGEADSASGTGSVNALTVVDDWPRPRAEETTGPDSRRKTSGFKGPCLVVGHGSRISVIGVCNP